LQSITETIYSCLLQIDKISDPVAETTYRDLWLATAKVSGNLCLRNLLKKVLIIVIYVISFLSSFSLLLRHVIEML
jgi:hypothetical protein